MNRRIMLVLLALLLLWGLGHPAVSAAQSDLPPADTSGYAIHPGMADYMACATEFTPIDLAQGAYGYRYLKILEGTQVHHINVVALSVEAVDSQQYMTVFVVNNRTGEVKRTYRFYAKAEALGSKTPNCIVSLYPQESVTVGQGETLMFGQGGDPLIWGYVPDDPAACYDLCGCWKQSSLTASDNSAILCIDVYTTAAPALSAWEADLRQALQGKTISVLGDSICAYWSVSNSIAVNNTLGNNRGWYGRPQLLSSVDEMWWKQVDTRYGLKLLVNNSWCRSSVTSLRSDEGALSYGWNTRPGNLHDNTLDNNPGNLPINPDIIVIYMGFNDIRGEVSCKTSFNSSYWKKIETEGFVPPATSDFDESFALMVYKVRKNYPDAQVYIFNHPAGSYLTRRQTYNQAIAKIAAHYGCTLVDLYNSPLSNFRYYTFDSVHPTASGMAVMADLFADALARNNLGKAPETQPGTPAVPQPEYTPEPTGYTGLGRDEHGDYYYYVDGRINYGFTGLVENDFGTWYVSSGRAQTNLDGMVTVDGTRYLLKAGRIWTSFSGIGKVDGVYYYFDQGINDLVYDGLVLCRGMKAYVQNGQVNFNKTAVVDDQGTLCFVKYGIWRNTYKGLARKPDGTWIAMVNGVFAPDYNGAAKLNNFWVNVRDGIVDFTYSGSVVVNGLTFQVKWGYIQVK